MRAFSVDRIFILGLLAAAPLLGGEVVLQDDALLAAFDTDSGALTRLENPATHWSIERRPELGVSFRLHAPLPDRRDNFVLGPKQHAQVEKISAHQVRLQWRNLQSEHGGVLPIAFTATVTLTQGALSFASTVVNQSPLTIETIDYPYLGDLSAPSRAAPLHARTMWYGNLDTEEIYPRFENKKGYWGVLYPTKTFDSNRSLFCLLQSAQEGLYVEMGDPTQPYLLQYTFEQHPGVVSGLADSAVPAGDALAGTPVHLEFRTTHFIFAHPHATVNLVPVVLQAYRGDWQGGVDLYKQWRATWFKPPHLPEWVQAVHSWQQLQINSPEDDRRVAYKDLPAYGEECARHGVGAIQLVGWNRGGQDGDDPSQDTDPALGTREELRAAIAQIQAQGVKLILFGKLNWADMTTDFYRRELYRYEATDPYGIPYQQGGYSYVTPTQLAGINNHRRAVMDFLSPGYRAVAVTEFQKLLGLGAAGWLFDENCHHGPVKYSFAPDHGYAPPGFIYGGDMPLAAQLHAASDAVNPDFLFCGEGHMDWLMQYYPCSYFRINAGSTAVDRYISPHEPLVVAVTGFDDRETINRILLDRYIISYEPYNFKGHLGDFPLTLAYGEKVDALRRAYRAWLWDAEFRDTREATVQGNGALRYAVFRTAAGKHAVVVANEAGRAIAATVTLDRPATFVLATPEEPRARPVAGAVSIPARSAAVWMEQ